MSYKSHSRGPTRHFDHLYDPTFTVGTQRDVYRANYNALSKSAPVLIYPIYRTMFTDLTRCAKNYYVLQQNPLPHAPFNGCDQSKATLARDDHRINRAKYFNVPLMKYAKADGDHNRPNSTLVDVGLEINAHQLSMVAEAEAGTETVAGQQKKRNVGCQTKYRESSAQTMPYLPDAVISVNEQHTPEIVYVADLIDGDNHPGLAEAEIIERARIRRNWEKSLLPQCNSTNQWNSHRHEIVEAFEWEQWLAREQQIDECQQHRLNLVHRLIDERSLNRHRTAAIKLENSFERLLADRDRRIQKLRLNHGRALRKLEMKKKNITRKCFPKDIVSEHIDKSSDLYAPQTIFGRDPKQRHYEPFKTDFVASFNNEHEVGNGGEHDDRLPPEMLLKLDALSVSRKVELWRPKEPIKEVKKGFWNEKYLEDVQNTLKLCRLRKDVIEVTPKCLEFIGNEKTTSGEPKNHRTVCTSVENFVSDIEGDAKIQQAVECRRRLTESSTNSIDNTLSQHFVSTEMANKSSNEEIEATPISILHCQLVKKLEQLKHERKSNAILVFDEEEEDADTNGSHRPSIVQLQIPVSQNTTSICLENFILKSIVEPVTQAIVGEAADAIARKCTHEMFEHINAEIKDNARTIVSNVLNQSMPFEINGHGNCTNENYGGENNSETEHNGGMHEITEIKPIDTASGPIAEKDFRVMFDQILSEMISLWPQPIDDD